MAAHLDHLLSRFVANPGLAGPHYGALPALLHFKNKGVKPLAAVALSVVLDSMTTRQTHRKLALQVGRAIEDEIKAIKIEADGRDTLRLLKKYSGGRRDQVVGTHTIRQLRLHHSKWAQVDCFEVGALLLSVVLAETKLLRLVNRRRGNRQRIEVEPTDEALAIAQSMPPQPLPARRLPMLVPPRPWEGLHGGGHLGNTQALINSRQRMDMGYLQHVGLGPALAVANHLQGQPLVVDPWMAEIQREAWQSDIRGLFPVSRDPMTAPPRPENTTDKETWKEWRRQSAAAWHEERQGKNARVRIQEAVTQCQQVAGQPIWFAYDLDFRGRVYSSNRYVTHQGPDWEKAAISFADPEPCSSEDADWLLKAAANHWGLSRKTWAQRLQWGRDNVERLLAVAEAPLDRLDLWRDAKDPWQFLQSARAFQQWMADPGQPIGIPIRFDQTTSGLGIISALVRDRKVARSCNLIGSTPMDLYGIVAAKVQQRLRRDIEAADPREQRHAAFWLELGVTRALAKGPVMTSTYGASFQGLVDGLTELITERIGLVQPWEIERKLLWPCQYMARQLQTVLRQEVATCLQLQGWLVELATKVVKTQQPVEWTTPMGFPMRLGAKLPGTVKANTLMHGRPSWREEGGEQRDRELSARATNRSITANLTHSFDAALVHLIVCAAAERDVQLLTNHDCFATYPARATWLHRTLHDEMRTMYQTDWLGAIAAEVASRTGIQGLPEPPMVGTLCPGEIGHNPYCFS